MTTRLSVPYHEKDEAKRLGAKWDSKRRVWYVNGETRLAHFLKWIPADRLHRKGKVATGKNFKILCECDVLPWEDCVHTLDQEYAKDQEEFFVPLQEMLSL